MKEQTLSYTRTRKQAVLTSYSQDVNQTLSSLHLALQVICSPPFVFNASGMLSAIAGASAVSADADDS